MSTNEQRLTAVLRALVESYDDTGCDGCGVVLQSAYEDAQAVLTSVGSTDASEPRDDALGHIDDARWVDPFEIVVGENPGPLNLASFTSLSNDPVDW
jgi:hypothetical protein